MNVRGEINVMMKFMRKSKGFISIFLCLVLLPMVTFSTMVIDVSRLQNARALVTSAGDLAMNAGMSEYNKTLQEMYGIFATSTSNEDLEKALANYFSKTIEGSIGTSNNLSEKEYIQKYSQEVTHWLFNVKNFDDVDFTNFLQMELEAAEAFDYIGVDNSSPANPAVMKQQIVDYMKYKGPVSLSLNLFNKIGALKDSKKQVDAVEKKVDYTQSLDNLTDPCEKAFAAVYGADTDYDSVNKGYNDYVDDYNKNYIAVGKDFENGLMANESKAYNNIEDNLKKMSVFLVYYHTAQISAGVIPGPSDKAGYTMTDLGGLAYEKFENYMTTHGDYSGYKKYNNLSDMAGCSNGFDELIGAFSLNQVKGTQTEKFSDKDFDKYFKEAVASIKIEVSEASKYAADKGNYVTKAELNKDNTKLNENDGNVSEALLAKWKERVSGSTSDDFESVSTADGKTYDLILQELDQGGKWKSVVSFIRYKKQIADLSASFESNWNTFDEEVKTAVKEKQDYLKGTSRYDYTQTYEGIKKKEWIETLQSELDAYDGENGLIKTKTNEITAKKSDITAKKAEVNSKQSEYDNEKDDVKKATLKSELDTLKAELSTLEKEKSTLDTELTKLQSKRKATEKEKTQEEKIYNKKVKEMQEAAEKDGELIVRKEKKYYETMMKKDIVAKLAEQVEGLDKTLKDEVLDMLPGRVDQMFDHGKPYLQQAVEQLEGFYVCVCNCYDRASAAKTCLESVESVYENVDTKYNAWVDSAKQVEDDTTKTTMLNDANTTSSGLKKKDITNAISIAANRQAYFERLKKMIENIHFYEDGPLVDESKGKAATYAEKLYKTISNHNTGNSTGDLDKDNRNADYIKKTKSSEIVKDHFNDKSIGSAKSYEVSRAFEWKPGKYLAKDTKEDDGSIFTIAYGDKMEGLKTTSLTSEPVEYKKEQFFKVLILIAKPKANNDENAKNNVNKITTLKNEAVKDDSSSGSGSGSGSGASGTVKENKSTAKEVKVEESVLKTAQSNIDAYGENGGKNEMNSGNAGSSRKDFTLTDKKDDYNSNNSDSAKSSLKQASGLLDKLGKIGTNVLQDAYLEEYFTEMFTCQTDVLEINKDNKMLNGATIEEMCKNDTAWYGGEMEYIIWGGGSVASAKVKNEVAIYAIRFALNAIYAFTAADIQEFTLTAATAIAGWTVVGVPLVQALLTIGLAAAESGVDLIKLKNGEDVAVYKNMDTFVCSPTGAIKEGLKTVATYAIEKGVSVVQEAVENKVDDIRKKGEEKISDNLDKIEELRDSYIDAQKENITTTLKNMIATPIVNKLKPIIMLKESAKDTFENDVQTALDEVFVSINDTVGKSGDGAIKELAVTLIGTYEEQIKLKIRKYIEENSGLNADQLSNKIYKIIDEYIGAIEHNIKEKLDDYGKKFMEEANKCGDALCNNIKELSAKWSTKAGESLTSSATKLIDDKLSDDVIGDLGITAKTDSGAGGGLTLNYKEYCKIFVLIGLINNENEAAMLQRCAALCEANVKNPGSKFTADSSFEMAKVNTVVAVHAKVKLGTLFPWGVTVSEDGATDSSSFGITNFGSNSVIIDYQGVNAY